MNDILNLGLGANLLELYYRSGVKASGTDYILPLVDIPQHVIAATIASTVFSAPVAFTVFVGLPLTFKVIGLCTRQGSSLNKLAKAGDHLMRLAAKVILITASFHSMFALRALSVAQAWAFSRTCILLYSFAKDAKITTNYLNSRTGFQHVRFG